MPVTDPETPPAKAIFNRFDNSHTKTAALITPYCQTTQRQLEQRCSKERSLKALHQPIDLAALPRFTTTAPAVIYTPHKIPLYLHEQYAGIAVYADTPVQTSQISTTLTDKITELVATAEPKVIPGLVAPMDKTAKFAQAVVTRKQLNAVKVSLLANQGRRSENQAMVMAAGLTDKKPISAEFVKTNIFTATHVYQFLDDKGLRVKQGGEKIPQALALELTQWLSTVKLEWTHLIAYRALGEQAQRPGNLVLATEECNSHMMVMERLAQTWLQRSSQEKITFEVTARLVGRAHFCADINYKIKTLEGYTVTLNFNPFMRKPPLLQSNTYVRLGQDLLRENYQLKWSIPVLKQDPLKRADETPGGLWATTWLHLRNTASNLLAGKASHPTQQKKTSRFFEASSHYRPRVATPPSNVIKGVRAVAKTVAKMPAPKSKCCVM